MSLILEGAIADFAESVEGMPPGKHTVDEECMPRLGYLLSLAA
jgi:hypothetical protein